MALNLAALLAVRDHTTRTDSQFVIFKPSVGPAFGIVVDQVGDIVSIPDSQTEAVSNAEQVQQHFSDRSSLVSSVGKLDGQLLIILDPRKFLACVEHSRGAIANV